MSQADCVATLRDTTHLKSPADPGLPDVAVLSDADMATFRSFKGAALDKSFLSLMIAHHEGALEMSRTELAQGSNPQAKALAPFITAFQTVEIATMKKLLAGL
jgi:uncharacterized protein (DUF305 family)